MEFGRSFGSDENRTVSGAIGERDAGQNRESFGSSGAAER
jgi:hypothetical protein